MNGLKTQIPIPMTLNHSFAEDFWSQKYEQNQTGWDVGEVSRPLKIYIDQLKDKNLKILIPGAGNAHEAEYLFKQGFKNIYIADISKKPLQNLKARVPNFPEKQILHIDFFKIEGAFDLILEQTFFCALPVSSRENYAKKMAGLLKKDGLLSGLFFNFPLKENGPPFGGSKEEYLTILGHILRSKSSKTAIIRLNPDRATSYFLNLEKNESARTNFKPSTNSA